MEDDITFGASVWGAPNDLVPTISDKHLSSSVSPALSSQDGLDEFDNFGTPAETLAASEDEVDDDFGDFGDFGEAQVAGDVSAFGEEVAFGDGEQTPTPGPSFADWGPLQLHPLPSRQDLQDQIDDILGPLWATIDISHLTNDDIRQAEGLNQTLVTPESRQLYTMLLPPTPPALQPVNWTRSRIRRRHLISLGIPVNLDEVLPRANGKLPMLQITTRPMSAPPGPRTAPSRPLPSASNSRAGTPHPSSPMTSVGPGYTASAAAQLRLGPKPDLDENKLSELLDLDTDSLKLLPVTKLETFLAEMKTQTINTSTVLTYLLQTRDALQQDSETYNKLIGELVGEAQKIKTGKRIPTRRGSGMT
ncbi:hypothetical protein BKA93DRAFT_824655 [Sparassis latifolia]|uniref:Uncharacterized protein n=1 Tax=Sparassis crispa TaxID=139825 RepID=A0A401GCW8_9APHY|nr:predicted protein [Sparassis crispa]GBE80007.1 predicted protein [Sparassis crispa]